MFDKTKKREGEKILFVDGIFFCYVFFLWKKEGVIDTFGCVGVMYTSYCHQQQLMSLLYF